MARFVFYCNDERSNIESFEYYKQDIEALEALGHEVVVCTRYREIPFHFDAMFVWWWTYALWPALLCRLLRRPCIITGVYNFRNPPEFKGIDYFGRPHWQQFLIASATRLANLNLFIGETEQNDCASYFDLENARYYPCIVHEDYLQGPSAARRNALFNLAWSGKGNLIRKGIPELLRAIAILRNEGVDLRLYQAGHRGDGSEDLRGMIEELQIGDVVSALGPLGRAEKIVLLRTCEIYVQPSHYEGFGLATAEAMGCGACVITCDVGAVRAVVGDCGIYVAPGSPTALAQAIKRALFDPELRLQLQRDAHHRALALFAAWRKQERLKRYLLEVGIV